MIKDYLMLSDGDKHQSIYLFWQSSKQVTSFVRKEFYPHHRVGICMCSRTQHFRNSFRQHLRFALRTTSVASLMSKYLNNIRLTLTPDQHIQPPTQQVNLVPQPNYPQLPQYNPDRMHYDGTMSFIVSL